MEITATEAARYAGLLVPLLVGLITTRYASSKLKAILNVVVSSVVGSTAYLVAADGGYDFAGFVKHSADAFLAGVVAYYGFLKPTGIAPALNEKTGSFGLGSSMPVTNPSPYANAESDVAWRDEDDEPLMHVGEEIEVDESGNEVAR